MLPSLKALKAAHPRHPMVAYLHGFAALACGQAQAAIESISGALALGLKDAAALFHLGRAKRAAKDLSGAADSFGQALQQRPQFTEARLSLANCQFELGLFAEAAAHYRALLLQSPKALALQFNLICADFQSGALAPDAAAAELDTLHQAHPQETRIQAALAQVLETANELDKSEFHARAALEGAADSAVALTTLARIMMRQGRYQQALDLSDAMPAEATWIEAAGLLSVRGAAHEKFLRHGLAMRAFQESKALQSAQGQLRFDAAGLRRELEQQRQRFFDLAPLADMGAAEPITPVFIVGFFRCGSSLLEQMLSMHPALKVCGESSALAHVESDLIEALAGDASKAGRTAEPLLVEAAAAYFNLLGLDPLSDHKPVVVDKQLANLLRLPLIRLLFPQARVIHVLRHPLDSAISTMSKVFLDGAAWGQSMQDIANYYSISWEHLVATRSASGLRYQTVRYEDLVNEPQTSLRQISEFLGVDWEPAMLSFHRNKRSVRTASYAQVTRPLYKDSLKRYSGFLPYIDPEALRLIEPVVQQMGYSL